MQDQLKHACKGSIACAINYAVSSLLEQQHAYETFLLSIWCDRFELATLELLARGGRLLDLSLVRRYRKIDSFSLDHA